jgi:hypothetical protein
MGREKRTHLWLSLGALAIATSAVPAHAATVTLGYDIEFSGARAPEGAAPWIIATFDDHNTQGSVRLTVSTAGLTAGENIDSLYFNLEPTLNPTQLLFTYINSSTAPSATSIQTGIDAYKADGDGKYDIKMGFPNGSGFDAGEALSYDITGISTLTAASFKFLSQPAGGHGPYYAAAHVQNTKGVGTGNSGWIAPTEAAFTPVPLPAAAWLLGSGIMMLAAYSRKRLT